jgi:chromosomal replication initiation ATPase DnaA
LTPGAKLTIQVSSNLTKWFSGKKHTTVIASNRKFIKVRDNTPFSPANKRHIRLRPVKR